MAGEFVRLIGLMLGPITSIAQQTRQCLTNLIMRNADVFSVAL
jgi:hypothetical protein